jgi:subtilisin family serine protease
MKRNLCLILVLLFAVPLTAETTSRYLVATRRPAPKAALQILRDAEQFSGHDVRTFQTLNAFAADLTESEVAALKKSPDVRYIEPVVERHLALEPESAARLARAAAALRPASSSRYSQVQTIPYGIDLIGARSVWPAFQATSHALVNVVVIDTGIDAAHPELKDRFVGGYNVFSKKEDPVDDHGHGTHVAGTIAAIDNSFGVVGVAPNVKLWAVKVLNGSGSGTSETVAAGIDWVRAKKQQLSGNWIISMSLGSTTSALVEREAVTNAIAEGIVVVAAAGNRSFKSLDFPAAYQGVLAITAIDKENKIADFSSFGAGVAFAAPGVEVLSTVPIGFASFTDVVTETGFFPTRSFAVLHSSQGEVTADFVSCGEGFPADFPAEGLGGKIALIKRSTAETNFRFRDKVRNAVAAGASAVIIRNHEAQPENMNAWTLLLNGEDLEEFPVVIGVGREDGEKLLARAGKEKVTVVIGKDDYDFLSGTSMATPHVSGATALIWTLAPTATSEQVLLAMKLTADDFGAPYYDEVFGYGRINPLAAAKYLAPATFNVPAPPPLDPKRKRQGH